MVLKRGKIAVGFMVLCALLLWVATAFVFKIAVLDYPYFQLTYGILLLVLLVSAIVTTRYVNELGRIEIKSNTLTQFSILGKTIHQFAKDDVDGYAISETDSDVGAIYNLVLRTKKKNRFISLWGLSAEQWQIQRFLGKERHDSGLLKSEFRRSLSSFGWLLFIAGLAGFGYLGLSETAAKVPMGEIASFDIPIAAYDVEYRDSGEWLRTELTDAYANKFTYKIKAPYFSEGEMNALLDRIDGGVELITIWTEEATFRRKIREENVGIGFWARHIR